MTAQRKPKPHDMGGLAAGPIDRMAHGQAPWEKHVNALTGLLGAKGLQITDERRRAMEDMDGDLYRKLAYYERWVVGVEALLIEKGVTTKEELDDRAASIG